MVEWFRATQGVINRYLTGLVDGQSLLLYSSISISDISNVIFPKSNVFKSSNTSLIASTPSPIPIK